MDVASPRSAFHPKEKKLPSRSVRTYTSWVIAGRTIRSDGPFCKVCLTCCVNPATSKYCGVCADQKKYERPPLTADQKRAHNRWKTERDKERYRTDPEFRAKELARRMERYQPKVRQRRDRDTPLELKCALCGEVYPSGWFQVKGRYADGMLKRHSYCRDCKQQMDSVRAARRRGIGADHTSRAIVRQLFRAQGHRCAVCARVIGRGLDGRATYHVDHIMPISKGGSHTPDNLQLLCVRCNLSKSDKHPMQFANLLGRLL